MRVCQFRHFGSLTDAQASELRHLSLPNRRRAVNSGRRWVHWGPGAKLRSLRARPLGKHTPPEQCVRMSEPSTSIPPSNATIPEDLALEIRRIAHELSNSLEVIVQTSYLLSMAELKEPATEWLTMLDSGVNKALELNGELREYIKAHTPR